MGRGQELSRLHRLQAIRRVIQRGRAPRSVSVSRRWPPVVVPSSSPPRLCCGIRQGRRGAASCLPLSLSNRPLPQVPVGEGSPAADGAASRVSGWLAPAGGRRHCGDAGPRCAFPGSSASSEGLELGESQCLLVGK
jgi:hypothetical protein